MLADNFFDSVDRKRSLVFFKVADFDNPRLINVIILADGHVYHVANSKRLVVGAVGVELVTAFELNFAEDELVACNRHIVAASTERG